MRIVTVGYLHGAGGAERQIVLLSNQMAELGHDVTLCVLNEFKSRYTISEKVKVQDLTHAEGSERLRIIKRLLAFRRAIKQIHPDVIVNYNLQAAYFCLTLSKKARGKVLYSERGDPYDNEYSGILGKIRDYTVSHMDGIVFQSEGARDFFPKKVKRKSVVIHNSVNVPQDKFPIPEKRDKRIVSVGRLHPQKNFPLLINAFARIASLFPDYSLVIYGDGDLREDLQSQIDSLGLTSRVTLNKSRSDVWDCIRTASLFVLSSDYEGMPNALMEAMALGLPCISTDCRPGGARTLISDGVNGVIVPVKNSIVLAEKMDYLLKNPAIAETLALEARKILQTHSEKMIFDKWNNYLINL